MYTRIYRKALIAFILAFLLYYRVYQSLPEVQNRRIEAARSELYRHYRLRAHIFKEVPFSCHFYTVLFLLYDRISGR